MNDGTYKNANARLTADINLSVYTNWTAIGGETNKYAGTFDGRGHEIKGLAVNITDAAGNYLYTGLFGYVTGTIKNLAVSGSITVNCGGVNEINAGGVAGQVFGGAVENCVSRVSVTSTNTIGSGARNYLGGVVGYLNNGSAANCTSYGNVTSEMAAGPDCTGNAGGVVGYNSDGTISNCVSYGAVTSNGDSGDVSNAYVYAGGITAQNWGTIENCTSYSDVATTAGSDDEAKTGGIAGNNGHGDSCVIKNCVVGAVSISQNGDKDKAGAILGRQGSGSTTNCAWEKGDNMPQQGIAGGTLTGAKGLDSLDGVVTSLSASIEPSTITKEGTATIKLTTTPKADSFDNSGAVRNITLVKEGEGAYDTNVVTVTPGENAASYIVTAVAPGATDITITADLHNMDFSSLTYSDDDKKTYTFTLPVTVAAETAPSQPGSGSTGGGGGGCSTGFGALALLAAVPLLLRRKK